LTILESKNGFIRYGEAAHGGVIYVNTRSSNPDLAKVRTKWNVQNKNDKMMVPINLYRTSVEFYNPTLLELGNNPILQALPLFSGDLKSILEEKNLSKAGFPTSSTLVRS